MEIKGKKFICSCRTVLVLEYDEPRTGWFLRKTCVDSGFSQYTTSLSQCCAVSVCDCEPPFFSLSLKSHHHINRSSPVLSSHHPLLRVRGIYCCSSARPRVAVGRSLRPPRSIPRAALACLRSLSPLPQDSPALPVRRWFSTASPVRVPPCSVATGEGCRDSLPGRRSPHVRLRSRGVRRLAAPPPPCRLCSCCS